MHHEQTGDHDVPDRPALPRVLSQKSARALLVEHGWVEEQGGKHVVKMVKPHQRPITLPMHGGASYTKRLTAAILRAAGLKGGQEDGE